VRIVQLDQAVSDDDIEHLASLENGHLDWRGAAGGELVEKLVLGSRSVQLPAAAGQPCLDSPIDARDRQRSANAGRWNGW
jgi:hypothetical protein